jgi:uncharacterized repeat protein (TIGR02543 family)
MHAQWRDSTLPQPTQYTIVFDSHESSAVTSITGNEGATVAKPVDPTRSGYTFQGWYSAEAGGALYGWPHTLTTNAIMHAQWRDSTLPQPVQYAITFNSHEGSAVQAITANKGTAVSKPIDPTLSGYTFQGWYSAASSGNQYTWPHSLTGNVTMHAQWQENGSPQPTQYTIIFDNHGGSAVTAITANEGAAVSKPADPTLSGYTFNGWYSAASGGTQYTWPHSLTGNVTMHAQWTAVSYTISYTLNDGTNGAGNPATYTAEDLHRTRAAPSRTV